MGDREVISLSPPRPTGRGLRERSWMLIRRSPSLICHVLLMDTFDADPATAQKVAAKHLGYEPTWTPIGRSYRAAPNPKEMP